MSMSPVIEAEYRAGLRAIVAERGKPVFIVEDERKRWPHNPSLWVSTYGWEASEARYHCETMPAGYEDSPYKDRFGGCSWVLPEQVEVEEVAYSEFQDTYSGNRETVGINARGVDAPITCACGKYSDVELRYEASLTEVLHELLGLNRTTMTI